MTNEEFQKIVLEKFNSLEEFQKLALKKFDSLEQKVTDLEKGQAEIKNDVSVLKTDGQELKRQVNVICEEVAGLLEYRAEMKETQKSISEIIFEHEIDIRTLKRRPV